MKLFSSIFLLAFAIKAFSQISPQKNSSEILSDLNKLAVTGSVLYIAAHPDDENTRLLAYLAKEKKYKTGYLSITRGDGGQNLIGKEQGEELGLIRTQELLAARRNDGALQFFTRANDFGFSKTPEETFKIWNRDSILSDVVYIIRKFRPDVIITRFPPDERAGHGQHAASSILAQEAFEAAADPKKFPHQLKELKIWKAHRILWNNYNFGGNDNTSPDQLKVDVGIYNPLLGKSYGEIAAESRSMHKSQGFGSAKQRGAAIEYFSAWKGDLPKNDLFEGIITDWNRFDKDQVIKSTVDKLIIGYDAASPQKSVPSLVDLYSLLNAKKDDPIFETKAEEVKNLILACAGTWFEIYSDQPLIAIGSAFKVKVNAISQLPNLSLQIKELNSKIDLSPNILKVVEAKLMADSISQPYWLQKTHTLGMYDLKDQKTTYLPEGHPAKAVKFMLSINGKEIEFYRPLVFKYTDQVKGEIYQPVVYTPPVTINLSSKTKVVNGADDKEIKIRLKAFKENANGILSLKVPKGWTVNPEHHPFELKNYGDEVDVVVNLKANPGAKSGDLSAEVTVEGKSYNQQLVNINYDHIPAITYFPLAKTKLLKLDLQQVPKKVGYLKGAGDLVDEMLAQVGIEVTELSESEIMSGDLSKYDAIIAGVRAYNVVDRIKFYQPKLLKYVADGGTYLVQYNVNRPLLIDEIGPYPFTISRERVTEEDAIVKFKSNATRILTYPYKLTSSDFEGWVQERGIYYATNADSKYEMPLIMNDTGEKSTDGALLVANYGKGKFIYTGLALFRQLPVGVPGAYRLLMNLISK